MKLVAIRDALRVRLGEMIADGTTSGSAIARSVGATQAHISNFLNTKRQVSFELADRLLEYAQINAEELIPAKDLGRSAPFENIDLGSFVSVPIVAVLDCLRPHLTKRNVRGATLVPQSALSRTEDGNCRSHWTRVVAVRRPHGELLVIDRHHFQPSRKRFAVYCKDDGVRLGRLMEIENRFWFWPDDSGLEPTAEDGVIGEIVQRQITE